MKCKGNQIFRKTNLQAHNYITLALFDLIIDAAVIKEYFNS